jgi:elongation factor P
MLSFNELKNGSVIIISNQPHQITEASFLFKGRGSSVLKTKLKNLITGNVISKTFHPSDEFEEAQIKRIKIKFLYSHKEKFCFCEEGKPSERFFLSEETIGESSNFLKENMILDGFSFKGEIINVSLPIKINLKVIESPPGIKGDRAQGGTKTVKIETGAKINVPLFIKKGDIIEVNTESGTYVRRIQ